MFQQNTQINGIIYGIYVIACKYLLPHSQASYMLRTWMKSLQAMTKDEINEVVVITTHSDPVKHELDKDLDEGKWVRVGGGDGADAARAEIMDSLALYREAPVQPDFQPGA